MESSSASPPFGSPHDAPDPPLTALRRSIRLGKRPAGLLEVAEGMDGCFILLFVFSFSAMHAHLLLRRCRARSSLPVLPALCNGLVHLVRISPPAPCSLSCVARIFFSPCRWF